MSDDNPNVARERSTRFVEQVRKVGARLYARRVDANFSIRDVEDRTGIDKKTISQIENGLQREISAPAFFAICEALGYDPLKAWYGDTGWPPPPPQIARPSDPPPASISRPATSRKPLKTKR